MLLFTSSLGPRMIYHQFPSSNFSNNQYTVFLSCVVGVDVKVILEVLDFFSAWRTTFSEYLVVTGYR